MPNRQDRQNHQIALLRGINVGRAKRIAMADLRALIAELGCQDVRTLLNSGNAIYTAPPRSSPKAMAARIEKALVERLRISSRVTVLSAAELAVVVEDNPLLAVADNPSRLLVAVFMDPDAPARIAPLAKQAWAPDILSVGARAAYLWCAEGLLASKLGETFMRATGDATTTRNWATILKLHAIANPQSPVTAVGDGLVKRLRT